jgi:hypothetical protein
MCFSIKEIDDKEKTCDYRERRDLHPVFKLAWLQQSK